MKPKGLHRTPMARRGFVMSSLITGLTLATARADTPAIHTDSTGLVAKEVRIPGAGRPAARLRGATGHGRAVPGRAGDRGDLRRPRVHQGRLPAAGALSATTRWRRSCMRGWPTSRRSQTRSGSSARVISKAPDATVLSDLDATVARAGEEHGDLSRLAVIGFCRGGPRHLALRRAQPGPAGGEVAFYGPVNTPDTPIQPHSPLDLAGQLKCPAARAVRRPGRQHRAGRRARGAGEGARPPARWWTSWCIRTRRTASTPTTGRATARPMPRTAWARAVAWLRTHGVE